MLLQRATPIGDDETAGELHDRLMLLGAELLLETLQGLEAGSLQAQPQAAAEATHAPKIFHDTCRIDCNAPASEVHNFIRGMSPSPGAWLSLEGEEIKLLRSRVDETPHNLPPGQWLVGKKEIRLTTAQGAVLVEELQPQGKRRMSAVDYINGQRSS